MVRISNAVVITVNAIIAVASLAAIGVGVYFLIHGPSQCQRFFQNPLIVSATLLFFVSSLGLIGTLSKSHVITLLYLTFLFLSILLILALSTFLFLVTNRSAGKAFSGDLRNWLPDHILRGDNWVEISKCLSESEVCKSLGHHRVDFYSKHLSRVQFGCCRPPPECGFRSKNATWWTPPPTTAAARAANGDCSAWSNEQSQLCFGCTACKSGVEANVRRHRKHLLIFDACLLLLLVLLSSLGCCARRNNNRVPWKRRCL